MQQNRTLFPLENKTKVLRNYDKVGKKKIKLDTSIVNEAKSLQELRTRPLFFSVHLKCFIFLC